MRLAYWTRYSQFPNVFMPFRALLLEDRSGICVVLA
jgi:hypothetical protein